MLAFKSLLAQFLIFLSNILKLFHKKVKARWYTNANRALELLTLVYHNWTPNIITCFCLHMFSGPAVKKIKLMEGFSDQIYFEKKIYNFKLVLNFIHRYFHSGFT